MQVTLLILAQTLVANDTEQDCPFCPKNEWGESNHRSQCPFAMAYLAIEQSAQQSVQATAATPRKIGAKSKSKVARKSRRA